jgi:hypothetical protein
MYTLASTPYRPLVHGQVMAIKQARKLTRGIGLKPRDPPPQLGERWHFVALVQPVHAAAFETLGVILLGSSDCFATLPVLNGVFASFSGAHTFKPN